MPDDALDMIVRGCGRETMDVCRTCKELRHSVESTDFEFTADGLMF